MSVNGNGHISIFLADDHHLFLDAVGTALSQYPFHVIGTARNGEDLLNKLPSAQPGVLLLDLNMPVMNGLEVIPLLKEDYPAVKILILTQYNDPKFVKECLQVHDVAGYVLKTSSLRELVEGINQVAMGQSYISKNLQLYPKDGVEEDPSQFEESFLAKYNLTRRELEILGHIAQAKNNHEIADYLYISPQTVGAHRKNIMRKLNITSTAGLVRFAIENQVG